MGKRFDDAIKRINGIRWENLSYTNRKSDLILAKEYIRRAALFMQHISQDIQTAFFSASNALNRSLKVDVEIACPIITKLGLYNKLVCKHYIEWASLTDEGELLAVLFEDLYEPLIILLERGVIIKMHHREFEIGECNYIYLGSGILGYVSEEPFDISIKALEEYDKES